LFAIITDGSRDLFVREQLVITLRYVNNCGHVIERFLDITHDTHDSNTKTPVMNVKIELVFPNMG
jgi:hypothetical protein